MQRRILVASINFAPDHAGIGVYSTDFPVYLAEQGDDVMMVTGFPYYPQWRKRPADQGKLFRRESHRGVKVLRGYLYVPRRVSAIRRLWHELTFCLFAGVNFLRAGRPDVIVVFTPPFFLGMVGVVMKWIWRCPLVINIQDLPLDAAVNLGMVRQGVFAKCLVAFEGWIYRRADQVVTISPQMVEQVRAKGVSGDRLKLVPNWINVVAAKQGISPGTFRATQPNAGDKTLVAYAGNLGIKQGVDQLLRLAKRMEARDGLYFFVIGDGADKPRLLKLAADLDCRKVTFLPFLEPNDYRTMLADVDIVFVGQRDGAGNNFFPSKLLGLMAQSKPLLVAADLDSELAGVVRSAGCGLVSAYGDVESLAANLEVLLAPDRGDFGAKGRKKVMEFDRAHVLARWRMEIGRL